MADLLPSHLAGWLSEGLKRPLPPREPRATCDRCAMCDRTPDGAPKPREPASGPPFDPALACCTYTPILPNFVVGRILRDPDPDGLAGRDSVRARIARHLAVTPLGLDRPHDQAELYRDRDRHFGVNPALRCPHLLTTPEGVRCGIWRHRNAICATWFCKHDRGDTGRRFWQALRDVGSLLEHRLAWHCLDTLGVDPDVRDRLVPRPGLICGAALVDGHPGGEPTPDRRRWLWGRWFGREEAYYEACADLVASLSWSDLRDLGGTALDDALAALDDARSTLERTVAPRDPRWRPAEIVAEDGAFTWFRGYSATDPLRVPTSVVPLLPALDGRPLEVVRARLGPAGDALTDGLIRALADWRLVD